MLVNRKYVIHRDNITPKGTTLKTNELNQLILNYV